MSPAHITYCRIWSIQCPRWQSSVSVIKTNPKTSAKVRLPLTSVDRRGFFILVRDRVIVRIIKLTKVVLDPDILAKISLWIYWNLTRQCNVWNMSNPTRYPLSLTCQ